MKGINLHFTTQSLRDDTVQRTDDIYSIWLLPHVQPQSLHEAPAERRNSKTQIGLLSTIKMLNSLVKCEFIVFVPTASQMSPFNFKQTCNYFLCTCVRQFPRSPLERRQFWQNRYKKRKKDKERKEKKDSWLEKAYSNYQLPWSKASPQTVLFYCFDWENRCGRKLCIVLSRVTN